MNINKKLRMNEKICTEKKINVNVAKTVNDGKKKKKLHRGNKKLDSRMCCFHVFNAKESDYIGQSKTIYKIRKVKFFQCIVLHTNEYNLQDDATYFFFASSCKNIVIGYKFRVQKKYVFFLR